MSEKNARAQKKKQNKRNKKRNLKKIINENVIITESLEGKCYYHITLNHCALDL